MVLEILVCECKMISPEEIYLCFHRKKFMACYVLDTTVHSVL